MSVAIDSVFKGSVLVYGAGIVLCMIVKPTSSIIPSCQSFSVF